MIGVENYPDKTRLENQSCTFRLLISTAKELVSAQTCLRGNHDIPQLEVLASLYRQLSLSLALGTLQSEHDFLRRLGLLVEDRLGLASVSGLLPVITPFSLGE